VRITVARHKNNYFLGWTEDQLSRLDAVVRPKLPVTPAVYREYCHRNAMKYDSNLQFACESAEPWAAEFRTRLTLPPADGGFSSLCEVKLEAGRLWREHSGRYRMHNIVKWQMGMNSAVLANGSVAAATAAAQGAAVTAAAKPSRTRTRTRLPLQSSCAGPPSFDAGPLSCDASRASDMAVSAVIAPGGVALCGGGGVLDMSRSAAAAADSGPLFAPLPADMPAADQLRVWLERLRRRYFVDAPPPPPPAAAVDPVAPRRWPVTAALLDAQIPPGVVQVLGKIDRLLSLPRDRLPAPARRFRDRLDAPAGSADAFATFEEAVTEALAAWSEAVSGAAPPPSRKRKRENASASQAGGGSAAGPATSDVKVSVVLTLLLANLTTI